MSIKIGNNNTINKSKIGHNNNSDNNKNFVTKHPLLSSLLISLLAGFIMLFSFWDKIISWLEN